MDPRSPDRPDALDVVEARLPRHAFTPRGTARAGDLWRLMQEVATDASTRRGWPPSRYRSAGRSFIIRSMRALHHREVDFGEALTTHTWVSGFRRGVFCDRQMRIFAGDQLVGSATQCWVHVTTAPRLRPERASAELLAAFPQLDHDQDVKLPEPDPAPDGIHWTWSFDCWHTWMDPLAHANHPAYVDWCDEALSRRLAAGGYDPVTLVPVGEEVLFRSGVVAPESVTLTSRWVGTAPSPHGPAVVCAHQIAGSDGRLCAEAVTLRHLPGLTSAADLQAVLSGR